MEPIIVIESTARGIGEYKLLKSRRVGVSSVFARAENCTCSNVIALAKVMGLNPDAVYAWGCPTCDPTAKES
jgi:hypothetical protein